MITIGPLLFVAIFFFLAALACACLSRQHHGGYVPRGVPDGKPILPKGGSGVSGPLRGWPGVPAAKLIVENKDDQSDVSEIWPAGLWPIRRAYKFLRGVQWGTPRIGGLVRIRRDVLGEQLSAIRGGIVTTSEEYEAMEVRARAAEARVKMLEETLRVLREFGPDGAPIADGAEPPGSPGGFFGREEDAAQMARILRSPGGETGS